MESWHDFFLAAAGASASLTGLIFVGVSISLNKMLAIPRLADRASEALLLLVAVLLISCLCLVPGQVKILTALEFLCIGISVWIITLQLDLRILHATDKQYKNKYRVMMLLTQLAVLPYILSGVAVLYCGFSGFYWLIPAVMFSFIKAVLDAWVILVEIHR